MGRTIQPDCPPGDVVMMRSPVGDRTSRVVEPPAESLMASLLEVLHCRRLTQPEIPVETIGHRHRRERTVAETGRDEHRHLGERPDATIANQLTRETEQFVAALLGPGLQHDALFAYGLDYALPFIDGEGQRLLRVDILPGVRSSDVDDGVPVIGRGVND